jgi:hypothetical protein
LETLVHAGVTMGGVTTHPPQAGTASYPQFLF